MPQAIKFKFDHNQEHQLAAIGSVVKLFDKLPKGHSEFRLGDDLIPNLPAEESFDEEILLGNLKEIQQNNGIKPENEQLDVDEGVVLAGVRDETWRYPVFTVEMETGTGKTYAYLRTIYELRKHYGFRKFIIVVPSIAIYEGVLKAIEMTREHFKTLYNNEHLNVIDYDSGQISKLREFANSQFIQVIVITMAAFNKISNNIYKRTEKLPGEKLPYQYIQDTRPILILDESQNYISGKSREALRTLHPLLAIKYSATAGYKTQEESNEYIKYDNLLYRLNPVEAFKLNLVKKIQVLGVTEQYNFNQDFSMVLKRINPDLTADMILIANNRGQFIEKEMCLKKGDDLETKTKNENYGNYKVEEINRRDGKVIFTNGNSVSLQGEQVLTLSRREIFRVQIEETIREHLKRQTELLERSIKVLSLFFIDKVASYVESDGIVKKLFDEAFEKYKEWYDYFRNLKPEEIREAYFAKRKTREGEVAIDTESRNEEERQAEKQAFELIMRKKEQLLSLDEKVCFVFAHSALKEGWDNPNVFQICTLRDTRSEMRKRQEIGRGTRLCVNQNGERLIDDGVNVLTVIANESYESFVSTLQTEYTETGDIAPPKPSDVRRKPARRNNNVYKNSDFDNFWNKLIKKTNYEINVNIDDLVNNAVARLSMQHISPPQILVKRGKFVITHIELKLISVNGKETMLEIGISDTLGQSSVQKKKFTIHDDLSRILKDERLRGFKITDIIGDNENPRVEFSERGTLSKEKPIVFDTEAGQRIDSSTVLETKTSYPVFNLIERAHKETGLTRSTIFRIFQTLSEDRKKIIFSNPEGFASTFIFGIKEVLADHIAQNIKYVIGQNIIEDYNKEKIFRDPDEHAQKELIQGSTKSLYDLVQIDSDIEKKFVEQRLNNDEKIVLYFKFPATFKVNVPEIIGNYNPDWGIVRLTEDGKYKLELVRETKATVNENLLQFTNERRKIWCAEKHYKQLGISYRKVTPETVNWWEDELPSGELFVGQLLQKIEIVKEISEELKYREYLPVYSLAAACGKFGEGTDAQEEGWIKADIGRKFNKKMFVTKVVGHSMEPRIQHNSCCVFSADVVGSRQGKIVLCQHHDITDPETGGSYTVKRYKSEKKFKKDGTWEHEKITLEPLNPEYDSIILPKCPEGEFKIIAEFVEVL